MSGTAPLGVHSEVGPLRQVVLHRPGLELERLTPGNAAQLLFDDVLWAERARQEHDGFAELLRSRGVVVHLFADLLAEALDVPGARAFLADRLATATRFGPALDDPLREVLESTPAPALAERLIGGLLKSDVPGRPSPACSGEPARRRLPAGAPAEPPVPARQRRVGVRRPSVNPMAMPARRRESLNSRVVYRFHPMFAGATVFYGDDDEPHGAATVEGGDVLVVGNGVVLVGMGERTTPQGVENVAHAWFASGEVRMVLAVELPRERAFMHLDTAMTMVDVDAFSMYPLPARRAPGLGAHPG